MPKQVNVRQSIKHTMISRPNIGPCQTRQRVSRSSYKLVRGWTEEINYNDFTTLWIDTGNMPIFYKLINVFLLLIQFNEPRDREFFFEAIKEILDSYDLIMETRDLNKGPVNVDIDAETIIKDLLTNIINLYSHLQLFPVGEKQLDKDLVLYHGIHKDSIIHKTLLKIEHDATFTLPIFMSTSVTLDVACRFTEGSKIIIRITVSKEDLNRFKYIYLGDTLIIEDINYRTENEFLLNLFTKLRFISKQEEEITYKIPYFGGGYGKFTGTFTIFDMKFIGHSKLTPENVKTIFKKKLKTYLNVAEARHVQEALNTQEEQQALKAQEALEAPEDNSTVMGGKTNKRKHKTNKRKHKTNKRKVPIKNLSIKYKFKNKKILTKSRKLYKKGVYTRKNYKTNN